MQQQVLEQQLMQGKLNWLHDLSCYRELFSRGSDGRAGRRRNEEDGRVGRRRHRSDPTKTAEGDAESACGQTGVHRQRTRRLRRAAVRKGLFRQGQRLQTSGCAFLQADYSSMRNIRFGKGRMKGWISKYSDKHLAILAPKHVETRFVKLNAEKCPFLCERLSIRVIPTLLLIVDGKTQVALNSWSLHFYFLIARKRMRIFF